MIKVKTYCFDLDGVICNNTYGKYNEAKPYKKAIKKINFLYDQGNIIIIFTSRYMGKFKNDRIKAINYGFEKTKNQLISWDLKFHELLLGKPEYDIIIDDKSIFFNKDWTTKI